MNTITHIKLATGADIVGYIVTEDEKQIELDKPMMVVIKSKGSTGYYHMSPYSAISPSVTFTKRFIVERGEVYPELGEVYTGLIASSSAPKALTDDSIVESDFDEQDIISELFGLRPKKALH